MSQHTAARSSAHAPSVSPAPLTRADLYGEESLTPQQIAEVQGVHRRTVYRWISKGWLCDGYKIGGDWYFPLSALKAMRKPQAVVQVRQRTAQGQQLSNISTTSSRRAERATR